MASLFKVASEPANSRRSNPSADFIDFLKRITRARSDDGVFEALSRRPTSVTPGWREVPLFPPQVGADAGGRWNAAR